MGLYKICEHKGRMRDRCEHAWWGSFRGIRVSLPKWANRDVHTKPLTSNPSGAILFSSSWSVTDFLNSRPPSSWVARLLPLTPRTDCGSTAVRC